MYPYLSVSAGRARLATLRSTQNRWNLPGIEISYRETQEPAKSQEFPSILLQEIGRTVSAKAAEKYFNEGYTKDQVEAIFAGQLYARMAELPAQALTDPDFWRFIATEIMADFIHWRDGQNCNWASFGLNGVRRIPDCVPLRMFNRAHVVHQIEKPSIPPLEAMKLGGTDYWQSHVLRVQNRFDPEIIGILNAGWFDDSISDVQAIRQIAKRIRQQRANVVLELQPLAAKQAVLSQIIGEFERGSDDE
jgi:hypothetical protein